MFHSRSRHRISNPLQLLDQLLGIASRPICGPEVSRVSILKEKCQCVVETERALKPGAKSTRLFGPCITFGLPIRLLGE